MKTTPITTTTPSTDPTTPASLRPPKAEAFIGIDFDKRYSVYHALDPDGLDVAKGRINHTEPEEFAALVGRWKRPRVVFEASMNWHWLFEILEQVMPTSDLVLANPFKMRIIAEAQVKTDKIDARILAQMWKVERVWRTGCKTGKLVLRSRPAEGLFALLG